MVSGGMYLHPKNMPRTDRMKIIEYLRLIHQNVSMNVVNQTVQFVHLCFCNQSWCGCVMCYN